MNWLQTIGLIAVASLAACGANTHATSIAPSRALTHDAQVPAEVAHGAALESTPIFMISDGNSHIGFGPGATMKRTPNGIEVTFHGVTRTFSSSARVDVGSYHKYQAQ